MHRRILGVQMGSHAELHRTSRMAFQAQVEALRGAGAGTWLCGQSEFASQPREHSLQLLRLLIGQRCLFGGLSQRISLLKRLQVLHAAHRAHPGLRVLAVRINVQGAQVIACPLVVLPQLKQQTRATARQPAVVGRVVKYVLQNKVDVLRGFELFAARMQV